MPEYTVIARAASALYFTPDGYFRLHNFPSTFCPLHLSFETRRSWIKDIAEPVPRGLCVEIRGSASTLREALDVFPQIAQMLSPVLTICGNEPTENLAPELAFDRSPESEDREFFSTIPLRRASLAVYAGEVSGFPSSCSVSAARQPPRTGAATSGHGALPRCAPIVVQGRRDHGARSPVHEH